MCSTANVGTVWVHNFGEVFLSSITPLLEMENMGVLDATGRRY